MHHMVEFPQHLSTPAAVTASRRAFRQAGLLIVLLVPAAAAAAWALAGLAGAARPEVVAGLTAALTSAGGAITLAGLKRSRAFPHRELGWCNAITLLRGAGIGVMAGLILTPAGGLGWGLVALAALVLALDGLDGWLARRTGMQSEFGARFDVESDVAFALVLAALAVAQGQVGPWFLALGLLRPAFLLAGRVWPALTAPLPDALWRKRMAGLQMTVQVALLTPVLAPPVSSAVAAGLLGAMVMSFAVDIRWLIRHR